MTSLSSIAAAAASRPSRIACSRSATDSPSSPGRTGASSAGPSAPDLASAGKGDGTFELRGPVPFSGPRPGALALLSRAAALFDAPHNSLRETAPRAWRRGFTSGAAWMRLALETVRAEKRDDGQGTRGEG